MGSFAAIHLQLFGADALENPLIASSIRTMMCSLLLNESRSVAFFSEQWFGAATGRNSTASVLPL
jgi:hypothetical protein